ncbi:PGPGW domain-containing protein [Gordonia sp. (in: high G+C Gram-positive bacteria)]|uniref:PGPGW domain-containing protein n=1 Tax=Gordonia sp. (in: high G+C Gram-positive bacteria) TaxID=84139 RepID=UPI003C729AE8
MRLRLKIWHRRHRYAIRQQPVLNRLYRFGVGVVGTLMVLAGMAMIPLPIPGPGWVTFFLGLGVLSTEFEWAHRVTSFMRAMLHKANVMATSSIHAIREFHGRRLDYQSGVRYVRSWMEHQRELGLGQFQLPQLALAAA